MGPAILALLLYYAEIVPVNLHVADSALYLKVVDLSEDETMLIAQRQVTILIVNYRFPLSPIGQM